MRSSSSIEGGSGTNRAAVLGRVVTDLDALQGIATSLYDLAELSLLVSGEEGNEADFV
jgi:hypothetical protein